MSSILLPLSFSSLTHIPHVSVIQEAVAKSIEQDSNLVISITCDEIKQHHHKLDTIWLKIQQFLSALYVIQLKEAYKQDRPLFNCDIVFQDVCGYPVYLEPSIHSVFGTESWNKSRTSPLKQLELSAPTDETVTLKDIKDQADPHVFQRVAVGGTFDHIHAGHKILLTMTALLANSSVVVGVTDDIMLVKKKHRDLIIPINLRIQHVKDYLYKAKRGLVYDVVPITDPYGPTITDPSIDAIVVSQETLKGGHMGKNKTFKMRIALIWFCF